MTQGATATRRLRVAAIVNPVAGGDPERAVAALRAAGAAAVEVLTTTAPGDAAELAFKAAAGDTAWDVIAAVGGDGTVSGVVAGLHRARTSGAAVAPLLVAPAGTGNSTYRGLWNDEPFDAVARRVLGGHAATRTIDLARIEHNGRTVVLGSGSGLFAATLLAVRSLAATGRPEKGRRLLIAAALAAKETHPPYPGRVSVDGDVLYEGEIIETVMGGFRYRGGVINLVPRSLVDDGLLDITVVTSAVDEGPFEYEETTPGGDVYKIPGVHWGRGTRLTVERLDGRPLLYEHDGEVMAQDTARCELRVVPAALSVLTAAEALPWFGRG